jgi:hypothetical protein
MALENKQDTSVGAAPPWHAEFPSPRDVPLGVVKREEMLQMLKDAEAAGSGAPRGFVLIDLRRTDYEVRHFILIFLRAKGVAGLAVDHAWTWDFSTTRTEKS